MCHALPDPKFMMRDVEARLRAARPISLLCHQTRSAASRGGGICGDLSRSCSTLCAENRSRASMSRVTNFGSIPAWHIT